MNMGWEYRFYDDAACQAYVEARFPRHIGAYLALMPVERSDFFRYLVILGDGGVYADVDTICLRPFDDLIQPGDRMLAGIEEDISNRPQAASE